MPKRLPRFLDNSDPLESKIEKTVCAYARTLGIEYLKLASPGHRSVPDRIFFPRSRPRSCFMVEFKRKGGKLTPAQHLEREKLRSWGVQVFIVDSIEEGKRVMELLC